MGSVILRAIITALGVELGVYNKCLKSRRVTRRTYVGNKYLYLAEGGMEHGNTPSSLANVPVPTGDIHWFAIERVWRDTSGNDRPFCEDGQTSTQCAACGKVSQV